MPTLKTNPNKANQYKPDPRQALFLAGYLDPNSKTFSNCLQSALEAGYEHEYAKTLTAKMPTWLAENVNSTKFVAKAERNLDEFLDLPTRQFPKQKLEATKFTLERLSKKYGKDDQPQQSVTLNVLNFYGNNDTPQIRSVPVATSDTIGRKEV